MDPTRFVKISSRVLGDRRWRRRRRWPGACWPHARARAARRRQIDAADEPAGPRRGAPRGRSSWTSRRRSRGPARGGGPRPAPGSRPRIPPAARAPPGAQILPFPAPGAPAVELPLDKPTAALGRGTGSRSATPRALVPGPGQDPRRLGRPASASCSPAARRSIPALVDELEKVLLTADIGVRTSQKLLERHASDSLGKQGAGRPRGDLGVPAPALPRDPQLRGAAAGPGRAPSPFVLLVIGVNGSGKTTTIGKLAAQLRGAGQERCCWPRATPSGRRPPSSWRSGASGWACRWCGARRAPIPRR